MKMRSSPVGPLVEVGDSALPAGTYYGQPLVWDGETWVAATVRCSSQAFTGEDNTVGIELPTPVPGFSTVCRWTVETANVFQVERDNVNFLNRVMIVGGNGNPLVLEAHDIGPPRFGALGATPVPRQSITGLTTQTQVDSIVSALVALGLVTDDR